MMHIVFKKKTVEEIIGYWIETKHIERTLASLLDYTDEVAELYDFSAWLKENVGVNGDNIVDVQNAIENADDVACRVSDEAEEKLKVVLKSVIESKDEIFARYADVNWLDKVDDILDYLIDAFDEIYEYEQGKQIENFYRILHRGIEEIAKRDSSEKN